VDRELKKQWKPKIEAFYTQAAALAPMLDVTYSGRNEYRSVIEDWCRQNNVDLGYHLSISTLPTTLTRQIVNQDDHHLRIPMMALVIHAIDGKRKIETKEDLSKIKSAYNRLMNKALSMYETKEV
jgi:hypothetical protein